MENMISFPLNTPLLGAGIFIRTHVPRVKQLRKQHKGPRKQLQALIDKTVPNDTATYRQTTTALLEANEEMKEGKKNLDRFEKVIQKSGKAVDPVATVPKTVM